MKLLLKDLEVRRKIDETVKRSVPIQAHQTVRNRSANIQHTSAPCAIYLHHAKIKKIISRTYAKSERKFKDPVSPLEIGFNCSPIMIVFVA